MSQWQGCITQDILVHSSNHQRTAYTFIHSLILYFIQNIHLMQFARHLGSSPYFLTELASYEHCNLLKNFFS